MGTPFTEAISTLSDRALRRLLGARAFLRGYDYVRRHAVENVTIAEASATGKVMGSEAEPYDVQIQLTPTGITSVCSCPAFSKINGHCKHVAALLIAVRDQVRPPRPKPPPGAVPGNGSQPSGHASAIAIPEGGGGRRSRRARARLKAQLAAAGLLPRTDGDTPSGVGAWLNEPVPPIPKQIEFRMQVRPGALFVSLLDREARTPLL